MAADFRADPVHDLRVSLRRCRSLADGMMAMDPDRNWKAMKKAGKKLFQSLGALRDVQIMMEWIEKLDVKTTTAESLDGSRDVLGAPGKADGTVLSVTDQDPSMTETGETQHAPADALLQILKERETEQKRAARAALEEFGRKQWRQWSNSLPLRAARIRPGSVVFKHLALERWTNARDLHTRAMRNRSQVALHALRIGIKRFRYIVENFLPEQHQAWGNDMKHMQDLLGDVHDLEVLWGAALACRVFSDAASRKAWHERIVEERKKRIDEYRSRTSGPASLWNVWRAGLPRGKQITEIATRRMKLWAKVLDPDFSHSERVAKLALSLYDGLNAAGFLGKNQASETGNGAATDMRASLYAAALLHDVGKAKGNKGHHKQSLELIRAHGTPLGWKAQDMQRAAIVARFHCGALPSRSHKTMRDLLADEQRTIIRLAAILRLANALDSAHDGHVRGVRVEAETVRRRTNGFLRKPAVPGKNEALVIAAEGYADGTLTAQAVAAERYLLETVLRRPVIVRSAA